MAEAIVRTSTYSVRSYGAMIADEHRTGPYVRALTATIRPGDVVLDIGAGTGMFSLVACRLGARRVYAIEPDNAIQVAREIAAANGYADRIEFIQDISTRITLPEAAHVIVSDLRGVLPLFQQHIPAIADARHRHLAPGGVLIPRQDTLWAALVEDPKLYRPYEEPCLHNDYALDMRAGQSLVVNTWRKTTLKPEQLLVPPQCWATLDYATIEGPDVAGELAWTVERACTAHGLLLWFDAELAAGVGFSNAPGGPELVYGQGFFPLQEPVALAAGDTVTVALRADLAGGDYTWQWRTRVHAQGEADRVKADFRQSTFFGAPLSLASLRKRGAGYRPVLDKAGQVDRLMLSLMDGQATLDEIARRALQEFPGRFAGWSEALTRAGELSVQHAEGE